MARKYKYTIRSKEEKLAIVKEVLAGKSVRAWEPDIDHKQVRQRVKRYQTEGALGQEPKKRPGNPLARYERRKELTCTEQLQYQIELLKRELAEKEAEVARFKQRNARREGDAPRKRSGRCMPRYNGKRTSTPSQNCASYTAYPAAVTTNGSNGKASPTVTQFQQIPDAYV